MATSEDEQAVSMETAGPSNPNVYARRPETTRLNPAETAVERAPRERLRRAAASLLRRPAGKLEAYSRGPVASVEAQAFLSPVLHS